MDTRRDFIKKAAMLSGGAGLLNSLPPSIQKVLAIDPAIGSTYLDAEHIVILMQENRSFDHCFGTLRGVRNAMPAMSKQERLAGPIPLWEISCSRDCPLQFFRYRNKIATLRHL